MFRKKGVNILGIVIFIFVILGFILLQYFGIINLFKGEQDFCPKFPDKTLCGICTEEKFISDNPYAGKCRYCPSGDLCMGDMCGEIQCKPVSSFTVVNKTQLILADVPYITKEGIELAANFSFPGYLYIYTRDIDLVAATRTFESYGGKVEYSDAGIYVVKVANGTEKSFLKKAYENSWVDDGIPASPLSAGTIYIADFFSDQSVFDTKKSWSCKDDHGNIVKKITTRYGANDIVTHELPDDTGTKPTGTLMMFKDIGEKIQDASDNCKNIVFSFSLHSIISAKARSYDRTLCDSIECNHIRNAQKLYIRLYLQKLKQLKDINEEYLGHTIIVIIAGNAGVDLDEELDSLKEDFPEEFSFVVIVGGNDDIDTTKIMWRFNHNVINTPPEEGVRPDMVYMVAKNVSAYANDWKKEMIKCHGTSFAAPEVAGMLEYVWRKNPDLNSGQILESFYSTLLKKGKDSIIPQERKGSQVSTSPLFIEEVIKAGDAMKTKNYNITGKWSGTYKSHYVDNEAFMCITDTEVPVDICITQKCKKVSGIINFPNGITSKTSSPEPGAICLGVSVGCSGGPGGQCSAFDGRIIDDAISFNTFTINGGSYMNNPYITSDKGFSHATIEDEDNIYFDFKSYGSSGRNSYSSSIGNFTVHRISKTCD